MTTGLRWAAAALVTMLATMALAAPFLSPYSPRQQFREVAQAPPISIHLRDREGNLRWPFVYRLRRVDLSPSYEETSDRMPIGLLVEGSNYSILGLPFNRHLVGLAQGKPGLFLLGTDELGRDLLSRIFFGARFSLGIGLFGIILALCIGVVAGTMAGYWGGWLDWSVMRTVDLFLSFPALFLILGLRALFPQLLSTGQTFWLVVAIFALVGWASVARVIRGQVLTIKTRDYVKASKAMGASNWWIITRHVLPATRHYLLVQAAVLIPAFVLGEVTLSFLGVGVQEPDASWGTLLNSASSVRTLSRHPWMLSPAVFLLVTVFGFNVIAEKLKRNKV